jgi:hypothetical protein
LRPRLVEEQLFRVPRGPDHEETTPLLAEGMQEGKTMGKGEERLCVREGILHGIRNTHRTRAVLFKLERGSMEWGRGISPFGEGSGHDVALLPEWGFEGIE